MLSIFEPDEYAQYPYLMHMLQGGTFLQSIHNFLVYGHYYYGYPFYFFSGLVMVPFRLILGSHFSASTPLLMVMLRETINVLPMLIAIIFLIWMVTRFRSVWQSLLLFAFLESVNALVMNNLWWHPDSLLVLFCVLTLFCLQKDELRFGKWFWLSAVACGMAVSTKVLGVLFVTTYVTYLLMGIIEKKITFGKACARAGIFLLIMVATIVVSTPQLLMPQERAELIAVFKGNLSENTQGFWIVSGGLAQNWSTFSNYIRLNYGGWILAILSLAALVGVIVTPRTRLLGIMTAVWSITYCAYFLFIAATLRPHYFLAVFLPLFALLAVFWPEVQLKDKPFSISKAGWHFWAGIASLIIVSAVVVINGVHLVDSLRQASAKEENSASIQFFNQVNVEYLNLLPADKNFTIYRDWRAYVEPKANWTVVMNWDLEDYSKLAELKPAVIFLEQENISYFSDPAKLAIALDETGMQLKYRFYSDAKNDSVQGYVLLAENSFGKVFARQDIYDEYLK